MPLFFSILFFVDKLADYDDNILNGKSWGVDNLGEKMEILLQIKEKIQNIVFKVIHNFSTQKNVCSYINVDNWFIKKFFYLLYSIWVLNIFFHKIKTALIFRLKIGKRKKEQLCKK